MEKLDLKILGKDYRTALMTLMDYESDILFLISNHQSIFDLGRSIDEYVEKKGHWALTIHISFLKAYTALVLGSCSCDVFKLWLGQELRLINDLFGFSKYSGENWRPILYRELVSFEKEYTFFGTYSDDFFRDLELAEDSEVSYVGTISDFRKVFFGSKKSDEDENKMFKVLSVLKRQLAEDVIHYCYLKNERESK